MCSYEKAGWPGYRDLRNRAGNFPIRTGQPGYQDEDFFQVRKLLSKEDEISIILTYLLDFLIKNDFWNLNE